MLAITGFFFSFRARTSSRQIRSDAFPSPPGESMRTTIAATSGSSAARRMRRVMGSDPAICTAPNGPREPSPRRMSPSTRTTAIFFGVPQRVLRTGSASIATFSRSTFRPSSLPTSSSSWSGYKSPSSRPASIASLVLRIPLSRRTFSLLSSRCRASATPLTYRPYMSSSNELCTSNCSPDMLLRVKVSGAFL